MDVLAVALIAGTVGLFAGAVGTRTVRGHSRPLARRTDPSSAAGPLPVLPPAFAALLHLLPFAALVTDADGVVLGTNAAAGALGAHRDRRLVSRELRRLVGQARSTGARRDTELELHGGRFGTHMLAFHAQAAPVPGTGTVLVLLDDRTEAQRVERLRKDFVANVSHELKTPVVGLGLLAEAVAGAAGDPEAVRRFARGMQRESRRLGRLVHDLLELSRLEGAEPQREPAPVPLHQVIREAVDRCRPSADARAISVVTAGDNGLTVSGDERQLGTALGNLIENAVSYSPDGSRVAIATRGVDGVVEVSVTDQGVGIPEAELERIFERFYRVDPARSRATGGTGLGLAIAKHVAANHGGEIRVWSVEGSGSTFTLRLPAPSTASGLLPRTAAPALAAAAHPAPEEAVG